MSSIADLYQIVTDFFSKANKSEIIQLFESLETIKFLSTGIISKEKTSEKLEKIILDYIKSTEVYDDQANIELNIDMLPKETNDCFFICQEFKYIVYREIDCN